MHVKRKRSIGLSPKKMIKIGIDANDILHGERAIRRYTLNLIQSLGSQNTEYQYHLLYFQFRKAAHSQAIITHRDYPSVYEHIIHFPGSWIQKAWQRVMWPPTSLLMGKMDLFHAPAMAIPPKSSSPTVVTLHSMAYKRIPEHMDPTYLEWYESFMQSCLKNADYFITVSESMRQDFLEVFKVSEDRVKTIPLGISDIFRPREKKECSDYLSKRFSITRPYLLFVGGLQPGKNVQGVLNAFVEIRKEVGEELLLVLVGDQKARSEEVLALIPKLGLTQDVLLTGYLGQESEELATLYSGAEVFIFPSFWEGWASPPLEAMASGAPVVASEIAPLRENLAQAALFADPNKSEAIASEVIKLLRDADLRSELIQRGYEQTQQWTWDRMAATTKQFYETILRV